MTSIALAYGSGTVTASLPREIEVETVGPPARPEATPAAVADAVAAALATPAAAEAFDAVRTPHARVTIVVAPGVPAPWATVAVRALCARLEAQRAESGAIRALLAREPDGFAGPAGLRRALGDAGLAIDRIEALGPSGVPKAEPAAGGAHRWASGADLRLVVSRALPHPLAGWAGGVDALVPGVLDEPGACRAIRASLDLRVGPDGQPRSMRGRRKGLAFDAATRAEARALGRTWALVLGEDAHGAPWAVPGDLATAHEAAVAALEAHVVVPAPAPADVVLLGSAGSCGRDVPSALASLDLAAAATRPGGSVLWCVPGSEGPGDPRFLAWFESGRLERHLAALRRAFAPEGLSAYVLRALAARRPIHLVGALGVDVARPLGLWPFADVASALAHAIATTPIRRALAIPRPDLVAFA